MAKKKTQDEKPQRERFIDFAKQHGADDAGALDRAFGDEGLKPKKKDKRKDDGEA